MKQAKGRKRKGAKSYQAERERLRREWKSKQEDEIKREEDADRVKQEEIVQLRVERRRATDGPFTTLNPVAKYQTRLTPLDRIEDEIGLVLRRSYTSQIISLQWKGLTKVPQQISNTLSLQFNHVHTLRLAGNNLVHLPNWTRLHFGSLTELNVSHNKLKRLPDTIGELCQLKLVVLDCNKLRTLPESFCNLTALQELRITGNELEHFHSDIGKLQNLRALRSDGNQLCVLPQSFHKLIMLEHLDLSRNSLRSIVFIAPPEKPHDLDPEENDWEESQVQGDTVYFNRKSGQCRRALPMQLNDEDPWADKLQGELEEQDFARPPKLDLSEISTARTVIGSKETDGRILMKRRLALARQGKSHWTCELNYNTGQLYYRDNVLRKNYIQMPRSMDKIGCLEHLHALILKGNSLLSVPASIRKLAMLKLLNLESNRLSEISEDVTNLPRLEVLEMGDNILTKVPDHISLLKNLKRLVLHRNIIDKVSPELGKLSKLETLWLMDNRLETLPDTLRHLENLKDFKCTDNPLKQPSLDKLISSSVAEILWEFRRIHLARMQGPTPKVGQISFGIADERRDTDGHFNLEQTRLIEDAKSTGVLALHWRGLKEIPCQVFHLKMLRELRLVGNAIVELPAQVSGLARLRVLELRNNKLETLSSSIGNLVSLEVLFLEDNLLVDLPDSVGNLVNLGVLGLSGNRIERLPKALLKLRKLHTLRAEVNHIEEIPRELFQSMESLRVLHLSKNRISFISPTVSAAKNLQVLLLDQNNIRDFPEALCQVSSLKELHLSQNQIEELPEAIGLGPLAESLEVLWLYANNATQLCDSFQHMRALKELRLDFNGMRSPPEEYSTNGPAYVIQYCKTRSARLGEMRQLLEEFNFEIDPGNMTPIARKVVLGGTGVLTQEDLNHLDKEIDDYVNGYIYSCTRTGKQIVDDLVRLRKDRESSFRLEMLRKFLSLLELLHDDKSLCSRVYFNPCIRRRWGRSNALIDCYALRLNALFEDQEYPEQRSIQALLRERGDQITVTKTFGAMQEFTFDDIVFQDQSFPITRQALEDALESYRDPHNGKISSANEPVRFKAYELSRDKDTIKIGSPSEEDEDSTKPSVKVEENAVHEEQGVGKRSNPFVFPAAVLGKIMFTPEEVRRESRENRFIKRKLHEENVLLEDWFRSREAALKIKSEVKRRKGQNKRAIAREELAIKQAQRELAHARMQAKEIEKRASLFRKNKPYAWHGFNSEEQARNALETVEADVKDAGEELIRAKQSLDGLRQKAKVKTQVWEEECRRYMKKKIEKRIRNRIVHKARMHAWRNNLRRPWDGRNGEIYLRWKSHMDALERERLEAQEAGELMNDDSEPKDVTTESKRPPALTESEEDEEEVVEEREDETAHEEASDVARVKHGKYSWSEDDSDAPLSDDEFYMPMSDEEQAESDPEDDGEMSLASENTLSKDAVDDNSSFSSLDGQEQDGQLDTDIVAVTNASHDSKNDVSYGDSDSGNDADADENKKGYKTQVVHNEEADHHV